MRTTLAAPALLEPHKVVLEDFPFKNAVLQAGEVGTQFRTRVRGQRIDPPGAAYFNLYHPVPAEVGKLLRHSHRAKPEHAFKVAHALRLNPQQVENPQAIEVTQALVDCDDLL